MQFFKVAAILSFAAAAVAVPTADVEARTNPKPKPNACKKGGYYYPYKPSCPSGDAYYCTTSATIAIANCVNILNGNTVQVPITDLIDIIL